MSNDPDSTTIRLIPSSLNEIHYNARKTLQIIITRLHSTSYKSNRDGIRAVIQVSEHSYTITRREARRDPTCPLSTKKRVRRQHNEAPALYPTMIPPCMAEKATTTEQMWLERVGQNRFKSSAHKRSPRAEPGYALHTAFIRSSYMLYRPQMRWSRTRIGRPDFDQKRHRTQLALMTIIFRVLFPQLLKSRMSRIRPPPVSCLRINRS